MTVEPDPDGPFRGSDLGAYIRVERTRLGLSQRDLAQALGVSQQTVSSWERGSIRPRSKLIPELAGILGAAISDLAIEEGSGRGGEVERHLRPVSHLDIRHHNDAKLASELTRDQRSFRNAVVRRIESGEPLGDEEIRFLRSLAELHGLQI